MPPGSSSTGLDDAPGRLLFIGNSFVARNDLPALVVALAGAAGRRFEPVAITAGGASLRRHLNSGAIDAALRTPVDVILLQEQSTLPLRNPRRYHENVRAVVDRIAATGQPGQPGRHRPDIVLYETWARADAPEAQAPLSAAVAAIADELGLAIAPVGQAWQRALAGPSPIPLHDRDGAHPAVAGSFLAAAVIALTLVSGLGDGDRPPIDQVVDSVLPAIGAIGALGALDSAEAGRLLRVAGDVVGDPGPPAGA